WPCAGPHRSVRKTRRSNVPCRSSTRWVLVGILGGDVTPLHLERQGVRPAGIRPCRSNPHCPVDRGRRPERSRVPIHPAGVKTHLGFEPGIADLRWHDLRHEYASRLVEKVVPLSQVRDLLGHASIVTTERYDNQKPEALMA